MEESTISVSSYPHDFTSSHQALPLKSPTTSPKHRAGDQALNSTPLGHSRAKLCMNYSSSQAVSAADAHILIRSFRSKLQVGAFSFVSVGMVPIASR